ncbi:hypothetical protein B0H14DRAFT_2658450 [Mycena olivaceomarginata]|nr:hypothetical protein B0H14DRAFT_2658450 [Mycena olivaceomarginata]
MSAWLDSPRWRNLKHLSSPTTIDYSEDSCSSCTQRYALDSRSEHLRKFIVDYEKICTDVSKKHDKSLNFLKQHFLSHAIRCFKDKGTSRNQNTRVGEGFQQEIAAQYLKTNGKDAEHQKQWPRLDMRVNEWQKSQEADESDPVLSAHAPTAHWRLGSPDPRTTSIRLETLHRGKPLYRDFNMRLREYLALSHPNYPVTDDENINIELCKVLYVDFQSKVDGRPTEMTSRWGPARGRFSAAICPAKFL